MPLAQLVEGLAVDREASSLDDLTDASNTVLGVSDAAAVLSDGDAAHPSAFKPALSAIAGVRSRGGTTLVLRPALVLAIGYLVKALRMPLLDALRLLDAQAGERTTALMSSDAIASLLRLELRTHKQVSDLSALADSPREWTWLRWHSEQCCVVVSRGRAITARRLRPEPRLAHLTDFVSADEAAHLVASAKASGLLHQSRVVNYEPGGDTGEVSKARTSESCKIVASTDRVVRCPGSNPRSPTYPCSATDRFCAGLWSRCNESCNAPHIWLV